jgi:GNAT superfamily N-acetyltransferase
MMFRKLIRWSGAGRDTKEFEAQLERERIRGCVLEIAPDQSWYISLGLMTLDELADSSGWVMKLYSARDGMVCIARLAHDANTKTILIGDIEADIENKGYGSIMLSRLLKLAEKLKIRELRGNLSSVDSDHFDKLEYFYKKHGFRVDFNPGKISGEVVLRLPE